MEKTTRRKMTNNDAWSLYGQTLGAENVTDYIYFGDIRKARVEAAKYKHSVEGHGLISGVHCSNLHHLLVDSGAIDAPDGAVVLVGGHRTSGPDGWNYVIAWD